MLKDDIGEVLAQDLQRIGGYIFAAFPVADSDRADYMVRNLVGLDEERGLLAIGAPLEDGQRVMFCRRDGQTARGPHTFPTPPTTIIERRNSSGEWYSVLAPMTLKCPEARFCARLSPWNVSPRSRSRPRTRRLCPCENPTASRPRSPKNDHPSRRPDRLTRFRPSRRRSLQSRSVNEQCGGLKNLCRDQFSNIRS